MKLKPNSFLLSIVIFILIIYGILINKQNNYRLNHQIVQFKQDLNSLWTKVFQNPHLFNFILNPGEKICQDKHILLITFVEVRVDSFYERRLIRKTWANNSLIPEMRVIFLTGLSNDSNVNRKLQIEYEKYQDIVQEDFLDTYRNLTLKTIMGYKWVSKYCSNAYYTLKVDSDIVVNVFGLIHFLKQIVNNTEFRTSSYFGGNSHESEIIRDPTDKFFMSYEEFPGVYYPLYHPGIGYIMSTDLTTKFYDLSFSTKYVPFEDVYTGLLALKLDVKYFDMSDEYIVDTMDSVNQTKVRYLHVLFVNTENDNDFKQVWSIFETNQEKMRARKAKIKRYYLDKQKYFNYF